MKTIIVFWLVALCFISVVSATDISTCINLSTHNAQYFLTADISDSPEAPCIQIMAENVSLNCQGHIIDGVDTTGANGIAVGNKVTILWNNVTVENCLVSDWDKGIYFQYMNYSVMKDSNVTSCVNYGAYMYYGTDNLIYNVNSSVGRFALVMDTQDYSNITNSFADANNGYAMYTSNFRYGLLSNNTLQLGNAGGWGVAQYVNNTLFINNIVKDFARGILIIQDSEAINITHNIILANTGRGMNLSEPGILDIKVWDNLFNNTNNLDVSATAAASFDIGGTEWTPQNIAGGNLIGGNYWDNYTTTIGYSQTCRDTDDNRLCDTAYTLAASPSMIDNYPLRPTTCIYGGGDWYINFTDNCTINTMVDVGGNSIYVSDRGVLSLLDNIYNFAKLIVSGDKTGQIFCYRKCFYKG